MALYLIKKSPHNKKRDQQSDETAYKIGENICKLVVIV